MERIAAEGKCLAYVEQGTLFVPQTAPGDVVEVQVTKMRKRTLEGYVVRYEELSPLRVDPGCAHFGACGGCQWRMIPYVEELEAKRAQVEGQLRTIGKVALPEVAHVLGGEQTDGYRNKLEFTFSPLGWRVEVTEEAVNTEEEPLPLALGFHVPGKWDRVLHIEHCCLQPEPSNAIRNFVYSYAVAYGLSFYDARMQAGLLRSLMVRVATTGEVMVLLVVYEWNEAVEGLLEAIRQKFPQITSLQWTENQKVNDSLYDLEMHVYAGDDCIEEKMENLRFRIGPKSFYQTNSRQAERLYGVVRDFAALKGSELVYDLYTGAGTIALSLAGHARHVVGVESVPEAIADAHRNAQRNGVKNVQFYVGEVERIVGEEFFQRHGVPDVVVCDPPRAGMHPKAVASLLELGAPRIVYVSCNPATQARDIEQLGARYDVVALQPVDMFPRTKHVENVALLVSREGM